MSNVVRLRSVPDSARVRNALNAGGVPAGEVIDRIAYAIVCPVCIATLFECCQSKTGRRTKTHGRRWQLAVDILEGTNQGGDVPPDAMPEVAR
jgi:hypothetical protein